ncbi:MAG: mycofactocin system GMC family oxidoreductase MftG [Chloroflexota bacterium]
MGEAVHGQRMQYDTIIVGSGAAGGVLAARLTEDPDHSVLLLEAGPDYPDSSAMPDTVRYGYGVGGNVLQGVHNWDFAATASHQANMRVPRGKVIGGSTAVNGQIFLRGVPEDYDSWAAAGNTEWSYEKLLPFFRKMETDLDFPDDFHGTDGPIPCGRFKPEEWPAPARAFFEAARDTGFPECPDQNSPDSTGVGPVPLNNVDRVRWSTAIAYLEPARHRLNLTVRGGCLVRRVLFEGKRAVGVEVESGGEVFHAYGREIILSGGAMGSPHILMLSGIGPEGQLREHGVPVVLDLPGVGQNLRDHPTVWLSWSVREGVQLDPLMYPDHVSLRYTASGSHLKNDMIIYVSAGRDLVARDGERSGQIGIRMRARLDLALGKGELRLASADPHEQPSLDYRYLEDPFDRERLREAVRTAVRISQHRAFCDIIKERLEPSDDVLADDDALDDWMLGVVTTGHHSSGTCRMGAPDDPMAVVDQYGHVHGLEGLRVMDASIMPDCVRANTNATVLAMGERAADFIRRGM